MKKCLLLFLIAISCRQNRKDFETKDWFEANLTLSSKKLYKSEGLQIIVNGKDIYSLSGDTTKYAIYKLFKIPETINEITIVSKYAGKEVFHKSIRPTSNARRFQIIVGAPYPKVFDTQPYPYQPKWFHLPIDSIKRDVTIKSDTSKNNIIL